MDVIKNDNEAFWGEVMTLRLRYSQQQKTVNKLTQFLSALVKPRVRKRSFQPKKKMKQQMIRKSMVSHNVMNMYMICSAKMTHLMQLWKNT